MCALVGQIKNLTDIYIHSKAKLHRMMRYSNQRSINLFQLPPKTYDLLRYFIRCLRCNVPDLMSLTTVTRVLNIPFLIVTMLPKFKICWKEHRSFMIAV